MASRHQAVGPIGQYTPLHLSGFSQPINTTPSLSIYAGTQTVTPSSVAGVVAGQLFTYSGGTGSSENVAVASLTSADFSGTFVNGHSGAYTVVATTVTTQNTGAITAGAGVVVTPVTGTLMTGIVVGLSLHIAAGGGTAEDVVVTAVTATTFTATFAFNHNANTAITLGTASNLTLTPTTNIGVAGAKTIAPTSMTNITVGTLLHISAGTGTAEDVTVISLPTANTITATFANTHSGAWTITTPAAQSYIPVGNCVNTTSATTIVAGSNVVVTPASMSSIFPGQKLNFANGTGTAENVRVKGVDLVAGTFRADFVNNHSGAYTISSLSGTFLGPLVVNNTGSGVVITLYNGNPSVLPLPTVKSFGVIAVIDPTVTSPLPYGCACDFGLFYTITGTTAPDATLHFIDMAAT